MSEKIDKISIDDTSNREKRVRYNIDFSNFLYFYISKNQYDILHYLVDNVAFGTEPAKAHDRTASPDCSGIREELFSNAGPNCICLPSDNRQPPPSDAGCEKHLHRPPDCCLKPYYSYRGILHYCCGSLDATASPPPCARAPSRVYGFPSSSMRLGPASTR